MVEARTGLVNRKFHGTSLNAGYPDLFFGGFWIEVKAPGKKLHESQIEWFDTFVPQGAVAYVCDDHRKLWAIIGEPPGTKPSNWKSFVPRKRNKNRMADALKAFQE
jgi:hypothetical protein